jgi:hypothetical protein
VPASIMDLHGLDHHASAEPSLSCSSGPALDRLSHVLLRSRRVWNVTYSSGITKMPTALAANSGENRRANIVPTDLGGSMGNNQRINSKNEST